VFGGGEGRGETGARTLQAVPGNEPAGPNVLAQFIAAGLAASLVQRAVPVASLSGGPTEAALVVLVRVVARVWQRLARIPR
jgi:hypothetical protein